MDASLPKLTHIFTVGDHYSPLTGSSYPTCIYELSKEHEAAGGISIVIVGKGTNDHFPPYAVGEIREVSYKAYLPPRRLRIIDSLCGALNLSRHYKWEAYRAALDAIPIEYKDWIIVHSEPALIPFLRKARPSARIALYCHYDLFRWFLRREVRVCVNASDAVVCVSDYIHGYVISKLGVDQSDKVYTVLNGVDTNRFIPIDRAANNPLVILFTGRVVPGKGIHLLVDAAQKLQKSGLDFRLCIVGGFHLAKNRLESRYERQLQKVASGLGEKIQFLGFVDRTEMPQTYQNADIFCAPSCFDEPFGLTVAEALSSGLPVICSNKGGIPEVVRDAGILFDVPDIAQLTASLKSLLENPVTRSQLGQLARKRALEIGWNITYGNLMKVLMTSPNAVLK